jgi:hypothetical protein
MGKPRVSSDQDGKSRLFLSLGRRIHRDLEGIEGRDMYQVAQELFASVSNSNRRDDHPWYSMLQKQLSSRFCLVSKSGFLLYGMSIVSAYKRLTPAEERPPNHFPPT